MDNARIQYYHFTGIINAVLGLFIDAYDLLCFPRIIQLLIGRIYYPQYPLRGGQHLLPRDRHRNRRHRKARLRPPG
ncbi:unnamed protein product [Camellia sinensis]